ncbi:MAG TPA: NrfD/PsrC family molybdoenzyme membrane anchor subunit [Tepidisphaeraceae bacterium]|jgi:molybdopterin-containing oxidoreductase family membrane subunit|nr:NrfD/PsrC family molybdoenzyme membrane anchor subunit [Tepidisphaeraceae bacterium]
MTILTGIFTTRFSPDETDNTLDDPKHRAPLVLHDRGFKSITDAVSDIAERSTTLAWKIGFLISLSLLGMLGGCIGYLVTTGVGVWGNNQPASWGFGIVNFVFWVGIGHAGTLISAILFLFRQNWRTGINRFAEAMTIFAVMCAALFPGIHVGRAWLAYWLFPIPNQMTMWPQFRSPLLWDVFAVGTYATVSIVFWYVGLIPDLATLRDRATGKIRQFAYAVFSLGWTGSSRHWHRYERAYLLLAALATPLVLSVHSVVSFDFATSQLPGWHTTIFPPYFVAGAVYGGFAMVLNLAIPARKWFGLKDIITMRHIDNCCKVMLATGLIVGYSYMLEFWTAWYSGDHYERFCFYNRAFGPYTVTFFIMMWCNVIAPQFLWSKTVRSNMLLVFLVALCANTGMWFERFEIIVTSLTRDFLPTNWYKFIPSPIDIMMLIGSFGLFFTLFMLFCRFLPVVAMAEVKTVIPQAHGHVHDPDHPEDSRDTRKSDFQPDEHFRPTEGHAPTLRPD